MMTKINNGAYWNKMIVGSTVKLGEKKDYFDSIWAVRETVMYKKQKDIKAYEYKYRPIRTLTEL